MRVKAVRPVCRKRGRDRRRRGAQLTVSIRSKASDLKQLHEIVELPLEGGFTGRVRCVWCVSARRW